MHRLPPVSAKVATVPRVAWSPPAPRRVRALRDRLRLVYGRPVAPPHGQGLEELILTVLSQSTNDRNRDVAYLRLRARFPAWEAVRDAPLDEVEDAIQPGGLHRQKSVRIQEILRALPDPPDLELPRELPVEEARDVPDRAARRRAQDRRLRAAVRVRAARRAGRHPRLTRRDAARACSAPARRSRSCTTRCSRLTPRGRRGRAPRQPAPPRPPHVPRAAPGLRRVRAAQDVPVRARAQARLERADHFASLLLHSSTDAPSPPRSMRVTSTPNTPEAREPRILPRTV